MNKQKLYILIISILGVLAALMPWINAVAFRSLVASAAGVQGTGRITLVLFAISCGLCFVGNKQEKFTRNFIYALWVIGGINIAVIIELLMNANKAARALGVFGTVNIAHGAYLTFLLAIGLIVFSIEQLQLVDKVDVMIQKITHKKTVNLTQGSEEVNPVIINEVNENSHAQENFVEIINTPEEALVDTLVQEDESVDMSSDSQEVVVNSEEVTIENNKA